MRLNAVLYMMIVLTPVVCTAQQDSRLEGCQNPEVIATVLGKLRQGNSRPISVEQLRAMWPTELIEVEVNPKTIRMLRSDDRILRSHCQCCESFTFKERQEGGVTRLGLNSATVNYSARSRGTLVAMAKLFARDVGLGAADLKTVGAELSQGYQWEITEAGERRLHVIELSFTREEGLWRMFFSTTFYVVEP